MKRIAALLLTLLLVVGLLPTVALAASSEEEALGEVQIYHDGTEMSYLSINGRVRTQVFTYYNYINAKGQSVRVPAYDHAADTIGFGTAYHAGICGGRYVDSGKYHHCGCLRQNRRHQHSAGWPHVRCGRGRRQDLQQPAQGRSGMGLAQADLDRVGHYQWHRGVYCLCGALLLGPCYPDALTIPMEERK